MLTIRLACLVSFLLLPSPPVASQGAQEEEKAAKPYKLASRIKDEIVLEDLQGKKIKIFEESFQGEDDRLLALVWWSLRDPQCQAYRKRLEAYEKEFAAKGVKLYLIASSYDEIFSGHTDPLEKFRTFVEKEKFTLPILIDHGNRIADDFGALTSGHAFIVDKRRYVRYVGGIDDDPKEKRPETRQEFLKLATQSILTGKKIKDPITRPIGRKIKRAPKKQHD